jgi:N-acetyl-anhydromuramyl-L-alanine amidase AmpD
VPKAVLTQSSLDVFMPPQQSAPADPTNYGNRYAKDVYGKPVYNDPLIVLHETVGSADSAINMFRTPHQNENDQSSYHSIIRRDGTIVYIVPPEKRAFGAGNSIFTGLNGPEAVRTHKQFPPSVNNFAYHISLETPPDGDNDATVHSGYTDAQYRSLAWLVAHTNIPDQRVTTHQAIDQSGSRMDPRSFDTQKFLSILRTLPRPGVKPQASGG